MKLTDQQFESLIDIALDNSWGKISPKEAIHIACEKADVNITNQDRLEAEEALIEILADITH